MRGTGPLLQQFMAKIRVSGPRASWTSSFPWNASQQEMGKQGLALDFCPALSVISSLQLDRSTREIELGLEYGIPTMNLAGQSLKFENGQWVAGRVQLSLL